MNQAKEQDLIQSMNEERAISLLKLITCGSVDDGKSTLIGRLLYESQSLFDDQLASLLKESRKFGTQGEDLDFALLVDGLSAEREQGITIDVAYRYFSTPKRKFIIADTPGHEQYTRNMITGASSAEVAIILVDAENGIQEQTKRHTFLVSLLGIKNIILAINKMDKVDYKEDIFNEIVEEFDAFLKFLNPLNVEKIPLSALKGDNLVKSSKQLSWFKGPNLLGYLEAINLRSDLNHKPFRFPVQGVIRPDSEVRAYTGKVASGSISLGDEVIVVSSNQKAKVEKIFLHRTEYQGAREGKSIAICLDKDIDISRGEIISTPENMPSLSDHFELDLAWLSDSKGFKGRSYLIKTNNEYVSAIISDIKYKYNINTLEQIRAESLCQNDIARVSIKLDKSIPFDAFEDDQRMGSIIVIDRMTNQTVAAGMIRHSMRRSENIHHQYLQIGRQDREKLNGHKSKILWFTGLSGSGKSTIANLLEMELHKRGIRSYILDGDNLRLGLNKDLGFDERDRVENIRRVSEVSALMLDAGVFVLACFISPFRQERESLKLQFGEDDFKEIFVKTSIEEAKKRDPKGLYSKAEQGLIPNFTGINSPYEEPLSPEIILDTEMFKPDELVEQILGVLDLV